MRRIALPLPPPAAAGTSHGPAAARGRAGTVVVCDALPPISSRTVIRGRRGRAPVRGAAAGGPAPDPPRNRDAMRPSNPLLPTAEARAWPSGAEPAPRVLGRAWAETEPGHRVATGCTSGALHMGQDDGRGYSVLVRAQRSMQGRWNLWPQGRTLSSTPEAYSSKQMPHCSAVPPPWLAMRSTSPSFCGGDGGKGAGSQAGRRGAASSERRGQCPAEGGLALWLKVSPRARPRRTGRGR